MHRRHHCPSSPRVSRDPSHLQKVLFALPLFDPAHTESLYDVRHHSRRRVPCPQQDALVAALADTLWTAQQQHAAQTRQAAALRRQLTRLLQALAALQATGHAGARPIHQPHARLLQRAHDAMTALLTVDLHPRGHAKPPKPDTAVLLALYTAFVRYGPPRHVFPREAIYTALAVLWQAFGLGTPSCPPPPLATLAARLGRRLRRHTGPTSSPPTG